MKRANYHILFILFITSNLFLSSITYSQWTVCGNLAGISGRPTVAVADENTVYVTGGSTVNVTYKTTNGGTSWINLNTGAFSPFFCLWAKDANTIFAGDNGATGAGKLYKTTDGGLFWTVVDSVIGGGFGGVKFSLSMPSFGAAFSSNTTDIVVLKTRDGGNTWSRTSVPLFPGYDLSISGYNVIDSLFYAMGTVSGPPAVILTTNGGLAYNLQEVGLPSAGGNFTRGIAFKEDKLTGIAASTSLPLIARTTNGGINWTNITVGSFASSTTTPVMRWIEGTNTCYITTPYSSGILKSINGGLNWTEMSTAGNAAFNIETKRIGSTVYGYAVGFFNGAINPVLKITDQIAGIYNISSEIPEAYSLKQNYPNPFNPVTNFEFGISKLGFVSLIVYDVRGKEVAALVNARLSPGTYKYNFDGSNLPSGVYFYKLEADGFVDTKKMYLVK